MINCGEENLMNNISENATLPRDGIGTIVAQIKTNDRVVLTFYQTESKRLLIRESRLADMPAAKIHIDSLLSIGKSFSEVYHEISGKPVTQALQNAETANKYALVEEMSISRQRNSVTDTLLDSCPACNEDFGYTGLKKDFDDCAPDYYYDNYGEHLFINKFVDKAQFCKCFTNVTSVTYRPGFATSWFKASAMAADFNTPIRFYGGYRQKICKFNIFWDYSCSYITFRSWDFVVQPRYIETIYGSKGSSWEASVKGQDPCKRAHLGIMYDNL
jgi:hypothetical protein